MHKRFGVAHLVRPLVAAPACMRTPDAKTGAHLRAHARGAAQYTWGSRQHTWGSRQAFVQGRGDMLLRLLLPRAAVCEKHVVETAECRPGGGEQEHDGGVPGQTKPRWRGEQRRACRGRGSKR